MNDVFIDFPRPRIEPSPYATTTTTMRFRIIRVDYSTKNVNKNNVLRNDELWPSQESVRLRARIRFRARKRVDNIRIIYFRTNKILVHTRSSYARSIRRPFRKRMCKFNFPPKENSKQTQKEDVIGVFSSLPFSFRRTPPPPPPQKKRLKS